MGRFICVVVSAADNDAGCQRSQLQTRLDRICVRQKYVHLWKAGGRCSYPRSDRTTTNQSSPDTGDAHLVITYKVSPARSILPKLTRFLCEPANIMSLWHYHSCRVFRETKPNPVGDEPNINSTEQRRQRQTQYPLGCQYYSARRPETEKGSSPSKARSPLRAKPHPPPLFHIAISTRGKPT